MSVNCFDTIDRILFFPFIFCTKIWKKVDIVEILFICVHNDHFNRTIYKKVQFQEHFLFSFSFISKVHATLTFIHILLIKMLIKFNIYECCCVFNVFASHCHTNFKFTFRSLFFSFSIQFQLFVLAWTYTQVF